MQCIVVCDYPARFEASILTCLKLLTLAHIFIANARRMYHLLDDLVDRLAIEPAILVRVASASGSVPRDPGAWMAVFRDAVVGTIGGGHLEWEAIRCARARLALAEDMVPVGWDSEFVLGPSLGQCCGGRLTLHFEHITAQHRVALRDRLAPVLAPVALFGGGHVGRAIVRALTPLPFFIHWVDSRDEVFPPDLGPHVNTEHSDPVAGAVSDLAAGSRVLIMSFSHAEDLDIVAACLLRQRQQADLPFVGLIGSRTKWASFSHRLAARGFSPSELAGVTCPIGLPGIQGKAPEVIAASVAAQLLLLG
jgi:xanthine dehydrogenase accessory factor